MSAQPLPTQSQILFPLLTAIADAGGAAKPGELYDEIARALQLTDEQRNRTEIINGHRVNTFERTVRWTRQTGVAKELIGRETRGVWDLTDKANAQLRNARPGVILTIYETDNGFMLWGKVEHAIAAIDRGSIQTLFCSPPYPLNRPKQYGNLDSKQWVTWMLKLCEQWRELLSEDGSMMINLGPTYTAGEPTQDPYIERFLLGCIDHLGLHLAQRLYYHNRTALPHPRQWVGVKRVRVKNAVEPILWLSTSPNPKADNRRVLVPYSESMKRTLRNGHKPARRPSGVDFTPNSFSNDNGGAIPSDLIISSNAASNDAYHRRCRSAGIAAHPATMPYDVATFCLKLTTEPGDLVLDTFAGSGTTLKAAEDLGRRWIGIEQSLEYIASSRLRFENSRVLPAQVAALPQFA